MRRVVTVTKKTNLTIDAEREEDAKKLNRIARNLLRAVRPPENATVSQWVERHRRLTTESSSETGPMRIDITPYLRDILDCFGDPRVKRIVMVAASQVGKSEMLNSLIGYIIDQDPGNILFVHPTIVDARDYSNMRIKPMIDNTPVLRSKVRDARNRDGSSTMLQKSFPGGTLTMCGSTEAHALASKPIRYLIGDERDRWAPSAGKEGDPWLLAMARQTTFYNAKSVEVSTPTIKGMSNIEKSYSIGTMERWQTKCPHCGEYHEIVWKDIRFEYDETTIRGSTTYDVKNIYYMCPECAGASTEAEMKKQPSKWVASNPSAYDHGVRSFWLNAFVSRWASWTDIILKFLNATGKPKDLQVVYNTCFGELWEDRGETEDEDGMLQRREEYGTNEDGTPVELPDGVLVLTAGVDTQDDRFEYEIVGYGHFRETWGIEKGIVMGRPDDDATWEKLDEVVFDRVLKFRDGVGLKVSMSFVDEGGHFTQEVRQKCRERVSKKVFCVKGIGGADRPYTSPPKTQKIIIRQLYVGTCWQYQIGVDAGKEAIMNDLRVQAPGPRYCHFPRRDDYGYGYFAGLLSERLEYDSSKKQPWTWKKIPGHERNEALDCRNYANAAFRALPADLDRIARKIGAARGVQVSEEPAVQTMPRPSTVRRAKAQKRYYDDW